MSYKRFKPLSLSIGTVVFAGLLCFASILSANSTLASVTQPKKNHTSMEKYSRTKLGRELSQKQVDFIHEINANTLKVDLSIQNDRSQLISLHKSYLSDHRLSEHDKYWVENLGKQYKLAPKEINYSPMMWNTLLRRVDVIPPSLVMAQSIQESGWGRSYLAKDAHNYFGQECGSHCYKGTSYQRFSSMYDAVSSYITNLNTNHAYHTLRSIRAEERARGQSINSLALTKGLMNYSTLRGEYVYSIQHVIESYHLQRFDEHNA